MGEEIEQAKHEHEAVALARTQSPQTHSHDKFGSNSSPVLTIDLVDVVETTDAALNYVASSSEEDSDDDLIDVSNSAASGRSIFSGIRPRNPKNGGSAVNHSAHKRQGHHETVSAAAAVAASQNFAHTSTNTF